MAKVLVTGGTGFVGREVVKQLRGLGYHVRLLARDSRGAAALAAQYGAEVVPGCVGDAASLDRACHGVDAVVHLVGVLFEKGKQTFDKIHVEGTENVVRAAERAGVKRYVHMSALGQRAADGSFHADYHRTKALAEGIVRKSALDWTIFRPSVIFGPGDGFVNGLVKLLRFPANVVQLHSFPLIGGGKTLLQPVAVSDVGTAFAKSISHADAVGKTYDLVGPERLSLRQVVEELCAANAQETLVENFPDRLLVRSLLWAAVLLVPLLLILLALLPSLLGYANGGDLIFVPTNTPIHLPLPAWIFAVGIAAWVGLVAAALRSRKMILFTLPWPAAFAAGAAFGLLPKPPLTMGQVWMLHEDNVGDAAPATAAFGLPLKGFREGIREYVYAPGRL